MIEWCDIELGRLVVVWYMRPHARMWEVLENNVETAPFIWVEEGEVDLAGVLDREEVVMGDVEKALCMIVVMVIMMTVRSLLENGFIKLQFARVLALLMMEFRASTVLV
jgi:hypothetical protein